MKEEKKDTRYGYYLRVLKFLCKRHNTLIAKHKGQNLENLAIKTTSKTWGNLLGEINSYRDKTMKAASLERSLRELKRRGCIEQISKNSPLYIVSSKGFEVVGVEERKLEVKKDISLPSRSMAHINIRCRGCNVTDGYLSGENICRYCGAKLYTIDKV